MTRDQTLLVRKAGRFFSKGSAARRDVVSFAEELLRMGPAVAIGGVLRDLHIEGSRGFRSDVDFVVHPASLPDFDRWAALQGRGLNRFGGFAMRRGRWNVDVWPLQRTWARVQGHRSVERLEDLVEATFFDWDAMVFDLAERSVFARAGCLEAMRGRVLDINLPDNPNPFGNAVRALRYTVRYGARLGPALSEHVARQVHDRGWHAFLEAERAAFAYRLLDEVDGDGGLAAALSNAGTARIPVRDRQGRLPLPVTAEVACTGCAAIAEGPPRRQRLRLRSRNGEIAFG